MSIQFLLILISCVFLAGLIALPKQIRESAIVQRIILIIEEKRVLFLFISISFLFFTITFQSAPTEISDTDILSIILIICVVCVLQVLISHKLKKINSNILLSVFLLVNVFTFNLLLNNDFMRLQFLLIALYGIVALFILSTFIKIVDTHARAGLFVPIGIFIIGVSIFANALLGYRYYFPPQNKPGMTSADNIRLVNFEMKPNVYLISLDSLIPESLYKKYFKTEEVTAVHKELDNRFYHFRNFFADHPATKKTLNSLLLLDRDHYQSIDENFRLSVFNGIVPSPLFELFKHNGYETNTLYESVHFGKVTGPYVDNYFVKDRHRGVCDFITKTQKKYAFFGYCTIIQSNLIESIIKYFDPEVKLDRVEYLLKKMRQGVKKDRPQILLGFFYRPGHTFPDHDSYSEEDFQEFKQHYIEQSKTAAEYLRKILEFIEKEDPNSLLYVFGDHGTYLSRSMKFEHDKEFYIRDRYGIYGGVYPRARCEDYLSNPYQESSTTLIEGMYMILRCLTGGEEVFLEKKTFTLPFVNYTAERDRSYETYSYE